MGRQEVSSKIIQTGIFIRRKGPRNPEVKVSEESVHFDIICLFNAKREQLDRNNIRTTDTKNATPFSEWGEVDISKPLFLPYRPCGLNGVSDVYSRTLLTVFLLFLFIIKNGYSRGDLEMYIMGQFLPSIFNGSIGRGRFESNRPLLVNKLNTEKTFKPIPGG